MHDKIMKRKALTVIVKTFRPNWICGTYYCWGMHGLWEALTGMMNYPKRLNKNGNDCSKLESLGVWLHPMHQKKWHCFLCDASEIAIGVCKFLKWKRRFVARFLSLGLLHSRNWLSLCWISSYGNGCQNGNFHHCKNHRSPLKRRCTWQTVWSSLNESRDLQVARSNV